MVPNQEILVDYLDKKLNPETAAQVEKMLIENTAAATDLQYLKLAVDTVRQDAIRQQVSAIRHAFNENQTTTLKPPTSLLRTLYRTSLRVAAILLVFIGLTAIYKYISVDSQSLYDKQFTGYELNNSRGQEITDSVTDAFKNKNWKGVLSFYNRETQHSNKSAFLAAMSEMKENHFPEAVSIFENLQKNITKTGDSSFQEETEYYLALAYLRNHETEKSVSLLEKIKADPSHTYYPLASQISSSDLKIIELKK